MKPWLAGVGAVAAGFIVTALASTAADAFMHAVGIIWTRKTKREFRQ